ILGSAPSGSVSNLQMALSADPASTDSLVERVEGASGVLAVRVRSASHPIEFQVTLSPDRRVSGRDSEPRGNEAGPPAPRWPQTVITHGTISAPTNACVIDSIELPVDNPWRRNVRLADIAFFDNGIAAAVTCDGDVWNITGLDGELSQVTWRRFASGLHEPLGICIRSGE